MKKIIINGGEFYKAFLVANYENVSLSANTFMTLVEIPKPGTKYLFEITRTPQSDIAIYNGGAYIVTNPYNECESPAKYTARINSSGSPILIKSYNTAITISVAVYEIRSFVSVKIPIVGSSAYDFVGAEKASIYQFPILESGKTFKVKLTPLYSGAIAFYHHGVQYQNDNAVANTVYEFEFTSDGDTYPMYIRDWSDTTNQCYIEINEA